MCAWTHEHICGKRQRIGFRAQLGASPVAFDYANRLSPPSSVAVVLNVPRIIAFSNDRTGGSSCIAICTEIGMQQVVDTAPCMLRASCLDTRFSSSHSSLKAHLRKMSRVYRYLGANFTPTETSAPLAIQMTRRPCPVALESPTLLFEYHGAGRGQQ